jgi:hypothetical protein
MHKIPCYWVQDMLPTYLDGLTSQQTTADVQAHLSVCSACQEMLSQMQAGEAKAQKAQNDRDINYLKKIKGKTRKTVTAVALAALVILAIPFGRSCVFGTADTAFGWDTVQVEGKQVSVHGSLWSSALAVSKTEVSERDGVITLGVRSVQPLFYHNGSYAVDYAAQQKIRRVETADGRVLWENGTEISALANRLYQAKTPYIGNASGVGSLLQTMDLAPWRSVPYHMSLQTDTEPYGLTLVAEKSWTTNSVEEAQRMKKYACLVLACVDNLGSVTYENGDGTAVLTFTAQEAAQQTGQNIKSWAKSVQGIQNLLDQLAL